MKFTFTECDYDGAFHFGGKLAITAETPQEVESIIDHFRLYRDLSDPATLRERIAALESSTLTHTIGTDKRPAYEVSSCLDHEFTVSYKEWAERNFGFTGTFPDLELPRKWGGLIHTNYQSRLYIDNEHICFDAFTTAEPRNKKDAQDYAESLVKDYVAEEFGTRKQEPEFIQKGNGQYYRNPNYLKRHRATPAATNARLKRTFFAWWLENHANDAQRAIVAGNQEISSEHPYMSAFEFERAESRIYYEHTGKDYKSVSFAEFAKLESN